MLQLHKIDKENGFFSFLFIVFDFYLLTVQIFSIK